MILYIKNGSLLTKRFKDEEIVDITHEAERYLFGTTNDCSEEIIGDLFEILNKNENLRKIFTVLKANAHGGKINAQGCHNDRKSGTSHCH